MSKQQKTEYAAYVKECHISNVEPSRADFLTGDIPSCVRYQMGLAKHMTAPKAMSASAGR